MSPPTLQKLTKRAQFLFVRQGVRALLESTLKEMKYIPTKLDVPTR